MKSSEVIKREARADCESCPLVPERREFLRSMSAFALAAISLSLPIRSATAKVLSSAVAGRKLLSYPVPATDGADIDRGNEVILVRYRNEVFAFNLSCPHQNNALKWLPKDHRFQCTKHDSQYQPDGVHTFGRATRNMDRYIIRRDGDSVVVDLHRWVQSDKDPAGWAAATIAV